MMENKWIAEDQKWTPEDSQKKHCEIFFFFKSLLKLGEKGNVDTGPKFDSKDYLSLLGDWI